MAVQAMLISLDRKPEQAALAGRDQQPEEIGTAVVGLLVEQIHLNRRGLPRAPKTVYLEGVWRDGMDHRHEKSITGKPPL